MKKSILVVLLVMAVAGVAQAAENVNVTVIQPVISPETMRYVLSTERRSIFETAMPLAEGKARDTFWNIYTQYEKEKEGLDKRRMALLGDYVKKFNTVTNEQSMKMVKETADINIKALKLREKYSQRIGKEVSGILGARFWQVDNYIASAVQLGVLDNIPLMGEQVTSRSSGK